jgi:hypothetical protein
MLSGFASGCRSSPHMSSDGGRGRFYWCPNVRAQAPPQHARDVRARGRDRKRSNCPCSSGAATRKRRASISGLAAAAEWAVALLSGVSRQIASNIVASARGVTFCSAFGSPPHRYILHRRIDVQNSRCWTKGSRCPKWPWLSGFRTSPTSRKPSCASLASHRYAGCGGSRPSRGAHPQLSTSLPDPRPTAKSEQGNLTSDRWLGCEAGRCRDRVTVE